MADAITIVAHSARSARYEYAWRGRILHIYGTYETSDGKYMSVGALEPQLFDEFVHILGLQEVCQQFGDHADHWRREIEEIFNENTARMDRTISGYRRMRFSRTGLVRSWSASPKYSAKHFRVKGLVSRCGSVTSTDALTNTGRVGCKRQTNASGNRPLSANGWDSEGNRLRCWRREATLRIWSNKSAECGEIMIFFANRIGN